MINKLWPYQIRALEAKGDRAIYCLKNEKGTVIYVGSSCQPFVRKNQLKYRKDLPKPFVLMILRWTTNANSDRIETQVILAYRRKGQAFFNKTVPVRANEKLPVIYVVPPVAST